MKNENPQGLNIDDFGPLLLADRFSMSSNEVERPYELFLFHHILLCCKDLHRPRRKRRGEKSDTGTTYAVRGNILMTAITHVENASEPELGLYSLKVFWEDGLDSVQFALKCRNQEQVRLWKDRIEKLVAGIVRRSSKSSPGEQQQHQSQPQQGYISMQRNRSISGDAEEDAAAVIAAAAASTTSTTSSGSYSQRGRASSFSRLNLANLGLFRFPSSTGDSSQTPTSGRRPSITTPSIPSTPDFIPPVPPIPINMRNGSVSSLSKGPVSNETVDFVGGGGQGRRPSLHQNIEQQHGNQIRIPIRGPSIGLSPDESYVDNKISNPSQSLLQSNNTISPQSENSVSLLAASPEYTGSSVGSQFQPHGNGHQQQPIPLQEQQLRQQLLQQQEQILQLNGRLQQLQHQRGLSLHDQQLKQPTNMQQPPAMRRSPTAPLAQPSTPKDSTIPPSPHPHQHASPPIAFIKIKTQYNADFFMIAAPRKTATFADLVSRLERKIKLCGGSSPSDMGRQIRIALKLDSGHMFSLQGERDVERAFEDAANMSSGILNLIVS